MRDFYIKEIRASGKGIEDSWVEFKPGVNIIHGASNTGKTYVIMCIDYMLGADTPPLDVKTTGVDTISMTLENAEGETFYAERKIVDAAEGSKSDSQIAIRTSLDFIKNGKNPLLQCVDISDYWSGTRPRRSDRMSPRA